MKPFLVIAFGLLLIIQAQVMLPHRHAIGKSLPPQLSSYWWWVADDQSTNASQISSWPDRIHALPFQYTTATNHLFNTTFGVLTSSGQLTNTALPQFADYTVGLILEPRSVGFLPYIRTLWTYSPTDPEASGIGFSPTFEFMVTNSSCGLVTLCGPVFTNTMYDIVMTVHSNDLTHAIVMGWTNNVNTSSNTINCQLSLPFATLGNANGGVAQTFLKELVFWTNVLTEAQITDFHNYAIGHYGVGSTISHGDLAGWWPMNHTTSTIARDLAGSGGYDTTLGGGWNFHLDGTYAWTAEHGSGTNQSLTFDGSSGYGKLTSLGSVIVPTNKFTYAFWVTVGDTSQSGKYLIEQTDEITIQDSIFYGATANNFEFYSTGYSGTDPRTGSAIAVTDTNWHHIAYSYDGSTWAGYKDGTNVFSTTRTFSLSTSANVSFWLGRGVGVGTFYKGAIDEFRFYNRGLSSTEIAALASP